MPNQNATPATPAAPVVPPPPAPIPGHHTLLTTINGQPMWIHQPIVATPAPPQPRQRRQTQQQAVQQNGNRNWLPWILGGGCFGLMIIVAIFFLAMASLITNNWDDIGNRLFGDAPQVQNLEADPEEVQSEETFSSICTNDAVYAPGWNHVGKAFRANGETDGEYEYVYRLHEGGVNVGRAILTMQLPVGVDVHAWKFYPGCGWGQLPVIK
jgi:hypothetical protein